MNKSIKDLKQCLKEEKNRGIKNYLENLTATETSDYSLWRATKKINCPRSFIPPIKKANGSWAKTSLDKATTFAEHLEKIFQPAARIIAEEEEISTLNKNTPNLLGIIEHAKVKEVQNVIKHLKSRKAPGYDGISGKMIKESPLKIIRLITIIINAIFRLSHFPDQWKVAQIILIHKSNKPAEYATSYRPISLLPILSKVCEKNNKKKIE